jgi:hypothetical protein
MKTRILTVIALSLTLTLSARAQVPGIINYQGRIVDGGTNFNGTGLFQFALVNNGGSTTYWSNGINTVSLTVTKGLYSVLLGDTTIANMTLAIPATVFTNADMRLRVWFNDGVNGLQQLSPDQRLAAAGYAMQAQNAYTAASATSLLPSSIVVGQSLNIGTNNTLASGVYASIGGGSNNTANGAEAFVGGGAGNNASMAQAVVGGGFDNTANGTGSFVGGGVFNQATNAQATVAGGLGNIAGGIGSFVGGGGYDGTTLAGNVAGGVASTVGGGLGNTASGAYSTVGGGGGNTIQDTASYSFIGGGQNNAIQAFSLQSAIGGGASNTIQINAYQSTIGGGSNNTVQTAAPISTISGGESNTIQYLAGASAIGGGYGNTIQTNAIRSTIGGGHFNTIQAYAWDATIGGGYSNIAGGTGSFVGGGGYDGTTLAGNTASGPASTVGGGLGNTVQATAYESTIGGGFNNTIQDGAYQSTIGGGSNNTIQVSAPVSTIAGGYSNTIQYIAGGSVIGGGLLNTIQTNAIWSTIAGGNNNTIQATAWNSTIGGGNSNTVSGKYGTVPGGYQNLATNNAFAAGTSAIASNTGAFVWSDDSGGSFASTSNNQFSVRAAGGVRFYSNAGATTGVILAPGAGSWSSASDRNLKAHFAAVNAEAILQALVAIPVDTWNYKSQDEHIHHIGPMAQDFYAAFGVGEDNRHISEIDAQGVAFAAIQGLNQVVKDKETEIQELRQQNAALASRLAALETEMQKVSDEVEQSKSAPIQAANVHDQGGL